MSKPTKQTKIKLKIDKDEEIHSPLRHKAEDLSDL